jgi:hypothetical protein
VSATFRIDYACAGIVAFTAFPDFHWYHQTRASTCPLVELVGYESFSSEVQLVTIGMTCRRTAFGGSGRAMPWSRVRQQSGN